MLTLKPLASEPAEALRRAGPHAPYLARLAERAPGTDFDAALRHAADAAHAPSLEAAMEMLRTAKAAAHLSLAAEDLSGARPVMDVTHALTEFATEALRSSLTLALSLRGLEGAGLFLVALGKMGAFELNYSSDIDIAAFYDPEQFEGGARGPADAAQRVVRDVVRLMDERTAAGYVFRTDLRLRPDPSSTPLVVSTHMAETYYESVGQNWERMVWIKGRVAAGDADAGARFLKVMQPYVWRRHLDYWAISDIQAIKRMINAKVGDEAFETVSPDVKLSPGGIREIEFYVQTQQLILGGRNPALRDNTTLGALAALTDAQIVRPETASVLKDAYLALRAVEHRIQMRHDEQTHTVPQDAAERESLAYLCGYDALDAFDRDLLETRRAVHAAYLALFAAEDRAAGESHLGNLVFTGVDDDPGTVATLKRLGFSNPAPAIDTIRNWHRGHVPATRTVRGRELLTALLPGLLEAMGRTGDADEAFHWFSRFFGGLSSGVQTLSMLLAQPALLEDLAATLALAPRLAEVLARRPDLLEALVSGMPPAAPDISEALGFDSALDAWRRYHREQAFLIGHRLLHGQIEPQAAGAHWSDLADATITAMAAAARFETERKLGPMPGRYAIFAMGKLGGREMTASSDLDLMVIYDSDALEAVTAYTRFTQRLITALTAPTAEGALYEVDMRLRPSGKKGPVAVGLNSFRLYQSSEAWTWEHMAMTRLRFVSGDADLGRDVVTIVHSAIAERARSDTGKIAADIAEMRQLLYREKPGNGVWDLKAAEGGLIDIEFLTQKALLESGRADLISANTLTAIEALGRSGTAPDIDWSALGEACRFLQHLQQMERVAIGSLSGAQALPEGLKARFARALQVDGFMALEPRLSALKADAHEQLLKNLQLAATD